MKFVNKLMYTKDKSDLEDKEELSLSEKSKKGQNQIFCYKTGIRHENLQGSQTLRKYPGHLFGTFLTIFSQSPCLSPPLQKTMTIFNKKPIDKPP